MSRDKPWLKMWSEWLGDAKMDRLSLAEQGAWWRLVSLAHECEHINEKGEADGALVVFDTPLSLVEIMKSLKITEALDKAVFNQMLDKMTSAGSLHWNSNALVVTHYEERQRALTDTKEARRQRQRERRESKKREPEKNPLPSSPLEPPITKNIEAEAEAETHAQSGHEKSVTQAQAVKSGHEKSVTQELSRCYERYIGLLNPLDADRMREFAEYYETHKGEIDWIEKAFKNAPVNKRRWPYVQAILERYIEEGGPHADRERGDEGEQPGADQRDIIAEARAGGWEVLGDDEPETTEAGNQD